MSLRALLVTDPLVIVLTVFMGTISFCTSLFDRTGDAQHVVARWWARMILFVAGVRVHVEGLENVQPGRNYVVAGNHLSLMDTPLLLAYLPIQFRFFAKRSLFSIPFLGWHLRRAGHLPVERDDPRAGLRIMTEGAKRIRESGISVLLFPEGSRSEDGRMQEFKDGASFVALKAGIPVLPIAIAGTFEVLPIGSVNVKPGRVTLKAAPPIAVDELTIKDRAALTERTRAAVASLLEQR